MFSKIDCDGNGYIDYTEFVAAAMDLNDLLTEEKLQRAFDMFDQDKSGSI